MLHERRWRRSFNLAFYESESTTASAAEVLGYFYGCYGCRAHLKLETRNLKLELLEPYSLSQNHGVLLKSSVIVLWIIEAVVSAAAFLPRQR